MPFSNFNKAEFLNLGALDISSQIVLCCGGLPYTLEASLVCLLAVSNVLSSPIMKHNVSSHCQMSLRYVCVGREGHNCPGLKTTANRGMICSLSCTPLERSLPAELVLFSECKISVRAGKEIIAF